MQMYGVSASADTGLDAANPNATTAQCWSPMEVLFTDADYDEQTAGGFSWAWPID
jgi:hypothetical protein